MAHATPCDGSDRRYLAAEIVQDLLCGRWQWAVQGAAAGAFVATAAKPLCDGGHVHPTLAAQTEADAVVAQFPQKDRNFDPPEPMA